MSEIALEDFSVYQGSISYCASQSIGTALGKLALMEEQGLYPGVLQEIAKRWKKSIIANQGKPNGCCVFG